MSSTRSLARHLSREDTTVELLDLDQEFTPVQLTHFKQAFAVFDVHKKGRVMPEDILQTLAGLGNEVSTERQEKIMAAIDQVAASDDGLDFHEFIRFMKIMESINRVDHGEEEGKQNESRVAAPSVGSVAGAWNDGENSVKKVWFVSIRMTDVSLVSTWQGGFRWLLVLLLVVVSTVHTWGITALTLLDIDVLDQLPKSDTEFKDIIDYLRMANVISFVQTVTVFLLQGRLSFAFDHLERNMILRTPWNVFKYSMRSAFLINAAASVLFVYDTLGDDVISTDYVTDPVVAASISIVQIILAYFTLSDQWYFETKLVLVGARDVARRCMCDMLILFVLRVPAILIGKALSFLLLPLVLIISTSYSTMKLCCKDAYKRWIDSQSGYLILRWSSALEG